ncbi:hypothetical protein F5Y14DRAFT_283768 [Nemania sp. NC0429]|nr:hypothetical protein F5Y14DRAFT_283768 [Nemania sp. NC0429]
MYSTKIFLPVAAFLGASLAETFPNPSCPEMLKSFSEDAPTFGPALESWVQGPGHLPTATAPPIAEPESYLKQICSLAAELPASLVPEFESWASMVVSHGRAHISEFDAFATECVSTGEAGASLTSVINSILSATGPVCPSTTTSGGAGGGPMSITPAPTATGITSDPGIAATSVVTAAADRAVGVLIAVAAMGGLAGAVVML